MEVTMLKGLGGLGGLGDMAKMMKAAQDMQVKMAELQETLARTPVHGESGAGLVRAIVTARGELTGLTIDPSIFSAEDKEVVEDLIIAAIKDAQAKARETAAAEMERLAQSLGVPAGVKLPF
jgi:DNA-binding YbaB/EbfC family protein